MAFKCCEDKFKTHYKRDNKVYYYIHIRVISPYTNCLQLNRHSSYSVRRAYKDVRLYISLYVIKFIIIIYGGGFSRNYILYLNIIEQKGLNIL